MTPDPAPYGAELPRPPGDGEWFSEGNVVASIGVDIATDPYVDIKEPGSGWPFGPAIAALPAVWSALDAANAEVLALRAERDALREVVEAVRGLCLGIPRRMHLNTSHESTLAEGQRQAAREVLALLPAPTEGAG